MIITYMFAYSQDHDHKKLDHNVEQYRFKKHKKLNILHYTYQTV